MRKTEVSVQTQSGGLDNVQEVSAHSLCEDRGNQQNLGVFLFSFSNLQMYILCNRFLLC